jgi:hypothetical protein
MTMEQLSQAFDIFHSYRQSILEMWSFFSIATLGVLGFTVGSEKATLTRRQATILQLGFLTFAIANLFVIFTSQQELQSMVGEVTALARKAGYPGFATVTVTSPCMFAAFHLVVSAFVVGAIEVSHREKRAPPSRQ